MSQTHTARPTAPAAYSVDALWVGTGDTITVQYAHSTETLSVVGEPSLCGIRLVQVRVREVGGRHDGNEFGAYLYLT